MPYSSLNRWLSSKLGADKMTEIAKVMGLGLDDRTPYQVFKHGVVETKIEEEEEAPEA